MSSSPGCGRSRADLEQPRAQLLVQLAAEHEAPVLERLEQLLGRALPRRPRVGQPLDALGVGVLRRGEAAVGQAQVAQHVLDGLLGHLAVALGAGDEPPVQVRGDEQRVVVEHLLEVRHEPALVDGVAVEAAADEVVHPAGRHRVERLHRRLDLPATQEQLERRGRRELRRPPEPAPLRVEQLAQAPGRREDERLGQRLGRRRRRGRLLERLDHHARPPVDVAAPLAVELGDRDQHLRKRRQPVPRLRREVRAAEERLARRA